MSRLAPVLLLPVAVAACGGGAGAPAQVAGCNESRHLVRAPLPAERGVYRAGPLALVVGEDLSRAPAGTSGTDVIVVVRGGRAVTLDVAAVSRSRFSFQFAGGRSGPSVHFPACGGRLHRFIGGITWTGPADVRLWVRPAQRRPLALVIPIATRR